jgi:hypothetical protein
MSKVKIQGNASGTGVLTVTAPNTSTDRTLTLPDSTGTLLTADGDGSNLTGISSVGGATGVDFNDSVKARFGTGNDLSIYHDQTNSQSLLLSPSLPIMIASTSTKFANGANDTLRMTIDGDGLKFGNDTAAANALDDYEEGTYTPVFKDTSNASMTGSLHSCLYTKIGRLVHVMVYYSVGDSQNGNLSTMTLPFNQTGSGRSAGSITTYACPNANKGNEIYLNGGSKVAFWQVRDNATSIPMAVDNGSELILSITYMTA